MIDPSVLVGASTSDDAAVYRLSDDSALVATLDFITPVVEDPEAFGAVAATNAISDVYAMGGRPIFALNVVNFPRGALPLHYLEAILRGGAAKATEAGIPILGGHSVDDPELKYGMVVLGMIHPDRIVKNSGARVGDRAGADQAARHRHHHDRDQGPGGRRGDRRAGAAGDDDLEPRRHPRRCWPSRRTARPT